MLILQGLRSAHDDLDPRFDKRDVICAFRPVRDELWGNPRAFHLAACKLRQNLEQDSHVTKSSNTKNY